MHVLVLNLGSSSIKYCLYDMADETLRASGKIERIGESDSISDHRIHDTGADQQSRQQAPIADHPAGLEQIFGFLQNSQLAASMQSLQAIGHRVVHGGDACEAAALIDKSVIDGIRARVPLAPLHNPINLIGIEAAQRLCPNLPQVAVFDTAFFRQLPAQAWRYALPMEYSQQHHVRRYGFHGISHQCVARQAAAFLPQPRQHQRLITLHLGNGASAAAIRGGICIDTSMGMTPLEGLIMGTRCGDLDPSLPFYLYRTLGMDIDAIETLFNRHSGLKGLCGVKDMREVHRLVNRGDEQARLAIDMYCYRVAKYTGAYYTALGGLDALVFTAGIGENDPLIRQAICNQLSVLGIALDPQRNQAARGQACDISAQHSRARVLVIPTNEELEIARQTLSVVNQGGNPR